MLFNSFEYLIFLPITFIIYWFVLKKSHKGQNVLLLLASYLFYGWWDYRFLSLILLSTLVDYFVGIAIFNNQTVKKRKLLVGISIVFNLGLLGVFKYFNFFIESWVDAWNLLGIEMHKTTLQVILPVGISFYTFQTLSYTLDIYRRELEPTKNFIAFAAYVSFFPQLVAGPIERASKLLPQILNKRTFNYENAVLGMRLMLWGFFKKIVIADGVAPYVDDIFINYASYSGGTLIFGAVLFAFQIYGDFSGYSDIAIGTAKLFGINLMRNFNYPYFSRDIAEFWRRWHISLSTWFRDYLYIPLGGSKVSRGKQIRNVFIIFLVSGFWHGANWTFIFWGGINALFFIPVMLSGNNRKHLDAVAIDRLLPSIKEGAQMLFTFVITTFAWIFFRADSLTHAWNFLKSIIQKDQFFQLSSNETYNNSIRPLLIYLIFFLIIEWIHRNREDVVGNFFKNRSLIRYMYYFLIGFIILINIKNEATNFIYFQF